MKNSKFKLCILILAVLSLLLFNAGCGPSQGGGESGGSSKKKSSGYVGESGESGELGEDGDNGENGENGENGSGGTTGSKKNNSAASKGSTSAGSKGTNSTVSGGGTSGPATEMILGSVWVGPKYEMPAGTSIMSDAYKKKFAEIKKKYNVDIKLKTISPDSKDIYIKSINAGDIPFHIMDLDLVSAREMAINGAFLDQTKISSINLNASQFTDNKAVQECVSFKGAVYGSQFGFPQVAIMGVYVNLDLIKKTPATSTVDVHKLYTDGKWNWTEFKDVAKKVTNSTTGTWGICGGGQIVGLALDTIGIGTVIRTASGNSYEFAMATQKGVDAMNWCKDLYSVDKSHNYIKVHQDSLKFFQTGKAAFLPTYLSDIDTFGNDADFEFTFLPFPKGTASGGAYRNGVHNASMFCLPKSLKNADLVGKVYQELSTVAGDITKHYKQDLNNKGLSAKGVEVAMSMPKYLVPEFSEGANYTFGTNWQPEVDAAVYGDGSPQNVIDKYGKQIQGKVNNYYRKVM